MENKYILVKLGCISVVKENIDLSSHFNNETALVRFVATNAAKKSLIMS
jgi:hypothetical protein